jgi:L-glyceraldehyde 3-phosphate reductase
MWDGPYGDGSSRKSIMANINQSLKRTGLDYFDIFYSHRYDAKTPVEETMQALTDVVRQGKALYVGLSKYPHDIAQIAFKILSDNKVPCLIYQDKYSMLVRDMEKNMLELTKNVGSGFIAFSPLAQGLLTTKYLKGIPADSRAAKPSGFLQKSEVTEAVISQINKLNEIAEKRGQSLAQMTLSWVLKDERVTSVIVGASSVDQLKDNLLSLDKLKFTQAELKNIDTIIR